MTRGNSKIEQDARLTVGHGAHLRAITRRAARLIPEIKKAVKPGDCPPIASQPLCGCVNARKAGCLL